MKVAYCFAGHSRTWDKCHESFFKNMYSVAPGPIFIHTWDKVSSNVPAYWNEFKGVDFIAANAPADIEGITKAYQPTQIMVESQRSYVTVPGMKGEYINDIGIKDYYESRLKAFQMAQRSGTYDRIIMTRLDIDFTSQLDPNELTSDDVYATHHARLHDLGDFSDLWCHASMRDMETLCLYYFNADRIYFANPARRIYHECAWSEYMREQGLKVKASAMKFRIPRIDGSFTLFPEK